MSHLHSPVPIDIGSRLDLMVDDYQIARLGGGARHCLNRPVSQEVALRMDAPWEGSAGGGELITKPLIFAGRELTLNDKASAAGSIQVELLRDQMNSPVEGYSLKDCVQVLGDDLERVVRWKGGVDLSGLAGTPIRLRFVLKDADLYSFRFRKR